MSDKHTSIPQLNIPDFKPAIPEYMLKGVKDDTSRYIIEQISVMSQQSSWQTHKIMNIHDYTRSINGKVIELEQFRNDLISQLKTEEEIVKQENRFKRHYKVAIFVCLSLLYPLYLTVVSSTGLVDIFTKILRIMP